ncbi:MAG: hypothetical protein ACRYFX_18850 [Janthinobacterium lividum]
MATILVRECADHYYCCRRAPKPPCEYVGTWPRRGRAYACRATTCPRTGAPRVKVCGVLTGPDYAGFKP